MVVAYAALARRWAHGWEIHIEGVGVTQCASLDDTERQGADLIETMTGKRPTRLVVTVSPEHIDRPPRL